MGQELIDVDQFLVRRLSGRRLSALAIVSLRVDLAVSACTNQCATSMINYREIIELAEFDTRWARINYRTDFTE
jgi:hypothetical protein